MGDIEVMRIRYLALASASLMISTAAVAQDEATAEDDNVIVVTGRGLDAPPSVIAYSTITLDRDQLRSSASGRIETPLVTSPASSSFAVRTAVHRTRRRKA